jgi:TPR repeat protein
MKMLIRMALVAVLALGASTVASQDFDKGLAAAQSGDYQTAMKEWLPLAERGDADAQLNIGIMYERGDGVSQNVMEASKWYRLAADQGNAQAQNNLGFLYDNGEGVTLDDAAAVKWYRMAAIQGYAKAQSNLGGMYANGKGILQNNVTAHMWFNIASANGYGDGAKWRDRISNDMVAEDISKAQAMASECMNSGYANCGW